MANRTAGSAAPPACAEVAILIWRPRGVAGRAPRGPSEAERGAGAGPGAVQRRPLTRTSKAYSAVATGCAASGSTRHWQAPYPNPVVADDHDSSGYQIFGNLVQVGQNDG
jgi:hypothetical protein